MKLVVMGFALLIFAGCVPQSRSFQVPPPRATVEIKDTAFDREITFVGLERRLGNETGNVAAFDYMFLRSWINRASGEARHQLYVENNYRGDWRFWYAADDDQARNLHFTSISRNVISCSSAAGCLKDEVFGADMTDEHLRQRAAGFQVRFRSKTGLSKIVHVDSQMIAAQLDAIDRWKKGQPPQQSSDQRKAENAFGLVLSTSEDRRGVIVLDVDMNSDAAAKGIRPGDRITDIGNVKPTSAEEAKAAFQRFATEKRRVAVRVERPAGNIDFIALNI